MIKLTKCYWDKDRIIPGHPVWVAPLHIQSINIITVAPGVLMTEVGTQRFSYCVIESPEEIMAMPEMVYDLPRMST